MAASSSSSSACSSENYGQLDEFGTLLFIPADVEFEFRQRNIAGIKNFQVRDSVTGKLSRVNHDGGEVAFLTSSRRPGQRVMSRFVPSFYPFVFAIPSCVTFTSRDLTEFAKDFADTGATAKWPRLEQIDSCPSCRKKTVLDGKTIHILCAQPAMMASSKSPVGYAAGISMRILFRSFCVTCFDRIAGHVSVRCRETGEWSEEKVIDLLLQGQVPPYRASRHEDIVMSAYDRYSSSFNCGLISALEQDISKYQQLSMGMKHVPSHSEMPGMPPKSVAKIRPKVFERCCVCSKTAWEVHEAEGGELGESELKPLKLCGGCKERRYCGRECQLADWKTHKATCKGKL